jgi:hypothetical protein
MERARAASGDYVAFSLAIHCSHKDTDAAAKISTLQTI